MHTHTLTLDTECGVSPCVGAAGGRAFNDAKDGVNEEAAQERVYRSCGEALVAHILEGHDATVIAYGQTSSGKYSTVIRTRDLPLRFEPASPPLAL